MQTKSDEEIILHLQRSFENADRGISKLSEEILQLDGMSGVKTRHLYNNIVSIADVNYLEIGSWKGSSFISALYRNSGKGLSIDNWSEFNGPRESFETNVQKYLSGKVTTLAASGDCFAIDSQTVTDVGPFDIYLYDGNHGYEAHKQAMIKFCKCLKEKAIVMIDDWNWKQVRQGTLDGLNETNYRIVYLRAINLTNDNSHTPEPEADDEYWNGIAVIYLKRASDK